MEWKHYTDDDGICGVRFDDAHSVGWDLEGWCQKCTTYMNLVAAAPDLLEVCKLFIIGFDELVKSNELDYENIMKAYEMAKAAIAKAQPNKPNAADP